MNPLPIQPEDSGGVAATADLADSGDLSLIRAMLKLSYNERLQQLEDHAALVQELRDANPALRVSKNS